MTISINDYIFITSQEGNFVLFTLLLVYNLQGFQAKYMFTNLQEFLKILVDSTLNIGLNLQSTKSLEPPLTPFNLHQIYLPNSFDCFVGLEVRVLVS
jgi:hypothetical protein